MRSVHAVGHSSWQLPSHVSPSRGCSACTAMLALGAIMCRPSLRRRRPSHRRGCEQQECSRAVATAQLRLSTAHTPRSFLATTPSTTRTSTAHTSTARTSTARTSTTRTSTTQGAMAETNAPEVIQLRCTKAPDTRGQILTDGACGSGKVAGRECEGSGTATGTLRRPEGARPIACRARSEQH
eukprot:3706510-Prymnesium_polylepis.1